MSEQYHGRFEKKKKKKGGKIVLIVLLVLVLLIGAVGVGGYIYYNSMLSMMNHVEVPKVEYTVPTTEATEPTVSATQEATEATVPPTTEPPHIPSSADYINFLLVGQAARVGESKDNERAADTIILCTLNTHEKTLTLTSILRDSFVKPCNTWRGHSFGRIKLTTVYHLGSVYEGTAAGSMELMNITLFNNFGIEVDHNFEISFDVFMDIVNALGGIEIELTEAEAKYLNADDLWVRYDVEPGLQKLDGMAALCYVRMRKAEGDADSDIKRSARQRKFVEAVLDKVKDMSPSKLQKLANKVLPMVTTSMSNDEITDLLVTLLPMLPELEMKTGGVCPSNSKGDEVDIYNNGVYHSVLRFNEAEIKKEMRAITEGEIAE